MDLLGNILRLMMVISHGDDVKGTKMVHPNGHEASDSGQTRKDPASSIIELLEAVDTLTQWLALCLHKRSYSGISLVQVHTVHLIYDEKANSSEISRRRYVTPSVTTGVTERLVRDGFLTRTTDPNDRRSFFFELTENGFRAYVEALGILEEEFGSVLADSGIDASELMSALEKLRKITSNLPPMEEYYK